MSIIYYQKLDFDRKKLEQIRKLICEAISLELGNAELICNLLDLIKYYDNYIEDDNTDFTKNDYILLRKIETITLTSLQFFSSKNLKTIFMKYIDTSLGSQMMMQYLEMTSINLENKKL